MVPAGGQAVTLGVQSADEASKNGKTGARNDLPGLQLVHCHEFEDQYWRGTEETGSRG